jgi:HAD superfamily hydrolase (TIGR01509 family)
VDEWLLAAVAEARGQGIRAYVATNQERYRVEYMRKQMGFDTHFDGIFSSAQLGLKKPDMRFFAAVSGTLALPIEQIIFWDDSQANIDAARAHGWQAELYTDYDRFAEQFQQAISSE